MKRRAAKFAGLIAMLLACGCSQTATKSAMVRFAASAIFARATADPAVAAPAARVHVRICVTRCLRTGKRIPSVIERTTRAPRVAVVRALAGPPPVSLGV